LEILSGIKVESLDLDPLTNKVEHKAEPIPYGGTIVDIKVSPEKTTKKLERKRDDLF